MRRDRIFQVERYERHRLSHSSICKPISGPTRAKPSILCACPLFLSRRDAFRSGAVHLRLSEPSHQGQGSTSQHFQHATRWIEPTCVYVHLPTLCLHTNCFLEPRTRNFIFFPTGLIFTPHHLFFFFIVSFKFALYKGFMNK